MAVMSRFNGVNFLNFMDRESKLKKLKKKRKLYKKKVTSLDVKIKELEDSKTRIGFVYYD